MIIIYICNWYLCLKLYISIYLYTYATDSIDEQSFSQMVRWRAKPFPAGQIKAFGNHLPHGGLVCKLSFNPFRCDRRMVLGKLVDLVEMWAPIRSFDGHSSAGQLTSKALRRWSRQHTFAKKCELSSVPWSAGSCGIASCCPDRYTTPYVASWCGASFLNRIPTHHPKQGLTRNLHQHVTQFLALLHRCVCPWPK